MKLLTIVVSSLALSAPVLNAPAQDKPAPDPGQKQPPPPQERPRQGQPPERRAPQARPGANEPGGEGQGPQARRGGRDLTPEQSSAAWEVQANAVAQRLELSEELTSKLVAAYVDARTTCAEKTRKLREDIARERGPQDPDNRSTLATRVTNITTAERQRLADTIAKFLPLEIVTEVLPSLSSFSPAWDGMVHTIEQHKLEPQVRRAALNAVETYVSTVTEGRRTAQHSHVAAQARQELTSRMKELLSKEQFEQFEAMWFGRRSDGQGRRTNREPAKEPGEAPKKE